MFTYAVRAALLVIVLSLPALACCPAPPPGMSVVNADQTVIILWDAANKTQHFIRKASFKSDAKDFGFIVPSPSQPELDESGNDAFPYIEYLTRPEIHRKFRLSNLGCGCGKSASDSAPSAGVTVLEQKTVAGFDATVLAATSAADLVRWLGDNGYAFSPEVEAWAKPYVDQGWNFTALKMAKSENGEQVKDVTSDALRISFKTDRPLFPYREPDSTASAGALGANHRLLRVYFLAEARYQGQLTESDPWTGSVAWSDKLRPEDRATILERLKLPASTGPAEFWLTEFEDYWPYRVAPADVYFSRNSDQSVHKRPIEYVYVPSVLPTDVTAYALVAMIVGPIYFRRLRRR